MSKSPMKPAALAAALLGCSAAALAADPTPAEPTVRMVGFEQGLMAARDPVTGQLRALTDAERAELLATARKRAQAAPAATPARRTHAHASGARGVTLGEATMTMAVARKGADGKISNVCAEDAAGAEKILAMPLASKELPHE